MDDDNTANAGSANHVVVGVKSWVAYIPVVLLAVAMFGVALPLAFMWNEIAAGVVMLLSAAFLFICILGLRAVQVYYDEVGVWVVSGILPWTRGVSGVKWRDMDEATFEQGFWSWLTGSYTIRIGHRFTKSSEIVQTKIAKGKDAVGKINAYQQNLIRDRVIS